MRSNNSSHVDLYFALFGLDAYLSGYYGIALTGPPEAVATYCKSVGLTIGPHIRDDWRRVWDPSGNDAGVIGRNQDGSDTLSTSRELIGLDGLR